MTDLGVNIAILNNDRTGSKPAHRVCTVVGAGYEARPEEGQQADKGAGLGEGNRTET